MKKLKSLTNWIDTLPPEIVGEIHKCMTTREFCNKEVVYRVGQTDNDLYQIFEGECRAFDYAYDGKELLLMHLQKGDCIGDIGLIDGLPEVITVEAVGQVTLGVLKKHDFDELCTRYTEILRALLLQMCGRLRFCLTMYKDATMLTLRQRLARILHRSAVTKSQDQNSDKPLSLDISQLDLSRMLGVTRQSVSKELKNLANDGLIEIQRGKIVINNLATLQSTYENLVGDEQVVPDYDEPSYVSSRL